MGYLANKHTGEFHDTANTNANCQLSEIKHKKSMSSMSKAMASGYAPCSWCMPTVLIARPRIKPASFHRGATVTVDATASRPHRGPFKITDYEWTIAPSDGIGQTITSHEETLTFRALGDFTATLTVQNSQGKSDPQNKDARCKARNLGGVKWHASVAGSLNTRIVEGWLGFGRNICALEMDSTGDQTSGHVIHRSDDAATWKTDGYKREQVDDSGPWNGCWYVTEVDLFIQRGELMSVDLLGSSDMAAANHAEHAADFSALGKSVRDHEHFHSSIYHGLWSGHGHEPVDAMEQLVCDSEDDLIKAADDAIIQLETVLQGDPAAQEAHVHELMARRWGGRSASVLIDDGNHGWSLSVFPDLSAIGDA